MIVRSVQHGAASGPIGNVHARADVGVCNHQCISIEAQADTFAFDLLGSGRAFADAMPPAFVSNSVVTKADYITALTQDKSQFLPDGMMPASGPQVVLSIDKLAGIVTGPVDLSTTYTNSFAATANKLEGFPG